jgi:short-subunit dehydrogenase
MRRNLRDMVVIITGASAGIGRSLATDLSARGAKLVLAARRLEKLQELNRSLDGQHLVVPADVSVAADCEKIVAATVERFGRIDTLVCNAGYAEFHSIAEMSADKMRQMFATNVFGTTDCIRAAVPIMAAQVPRDGYRGQIMIVSSAAARRGLPYNGAYSATKAAQLSIAEALRIELQPMAIAVSCVLPIGTETDFFTSASQMSGRSIDPPEKPSKRHPVKRVVLGMVRAIEKPRAEVWSSKSTRWGLAMNGVFPTLGDPVLLQQMRAFQKINNLTT